MGKQLLAEIRPLGYTGSLTHLQRLLNCWRRAHFAAAIGTPAPVALQDFVAPAAPPIVAAALCIKPRGLLTRLRLPRWISLRNYPAILQQCGNSPWAFEGFSREGIPSR